MSNEFVKFNKLVKKIASGAIPTDTTKPIFMTLLSVSPLCFQMESDKNIKAYKDFLVVPKYRIFKKSEIGKKFVFILGDDGQTFFYLYEPSFPQGSNGVEYMFSADILECNLKGTCPHGDVTVTKGTIKSMTHKGVVE